MELALYCPLCGYYEKKEDTPGKHGDFYTSVSVGPLFGELLAFQFGEWFAQSTVHSPRSKVADSAEAACSIMEAGAQDGRLARDILNWLKLRRAACFEKLIYTIIEPSPRRREWQQEMLREFGDKISWVEHLPNASAVTPRNTQHATRFTIIFSNELLDAFPVHRLGWDAKTKSWYEWGVALRGKEFIWQRIEDALHASRFTLHAPPELLPALPDGFTTEVCPAAEQWWRAAASGLQYGRLLTFDYGLRAEDFFTPQRTHGTLRAYRRHQLCDDVLAAPGEQDLTAHVNFTAIQQAGEAAGLKTESLVSQAQFLTGIAQRVWQENSGFGDWTRERTRQFQTLTHPQHLGRTFQALVQSREEHSS